MPSFYEFFAGGGMARAGLGAGWTCVFANDIDSKKTSAYARNWSDKEIVTRDVRRLSPKDLPGIADLGWASFPCQDLSLAGSRAGLNGSRSGTFWPFWKLMTALAVERRAPRTIVLENVCGAVTSHGGADFQSIIEALRKQKFRYGALVLDAALFVPQSRPRLFIIGVRADIDIDNALISDGPGDPFHNAALRHAYSRLWPTERAAWIWWKLPRPTCRPQSVADILEESPCGTRWHNESETRTLLSLMSPVHLSKVEAAKRTGTVTVGSLYKRTRRDGSGARVQRAEVRFDNVAGCLRTPGGGSSRQTIIVVHGQNVRSRLLSARETARLMGLPDDYVLPDRYNEACHLTGDGVVVPVVRYLAQNIIEPLIRSAKGADARPPNNGGTRLTFGRRARQRDRFARVPQNYA